MKKLFLLFLVGSISMFLVFANGQGEKKGKEEGGGTTLAISIRSLSNPYMVSYKDGGEKFASTMGLPFVTLTSDGNSEKQVNDAKAIIAKTGGDVVFMLDPNEPPITVPLAKVFEEAGVYYVTWWNKSNDQKVWDYPHWVAHISYDGVSSGYDVAKELFKAMGNEGEIVAVQGILSNGSAIERFSGLEKALEETPNVKMVAFEAANWDRNQAYDKTISLLASYPNIKGIWAANDNMALGAIEALKSKGLDKKIPVVGTDGVPEMFDAIRNGQAVATVYNDGKYQAGIALAMSLAAKKGELDVASLSKDKRQFYMKAVFVNADNVEDVYSQYVENTPDYDFSDFYKFWVKGME